MARLWFGIKVLTGYVAFLLSLFCGLVSFACLFASDRYWTLGFISGLMALALTLYQKNLALTLQEEEELAERRKNAGLE